MVYGAQKIIETQSNDATKEPSPQKIITIKVCCRIRPMNDREIDNPINCDLIGDNSLRIKQQSTVSSIGDFSKWKTGILGV